MPRFENRNLVIIKQNLPQPQSPHDLVREAFVWLGVRVIVGIIVVALGIVFFVFVIDLIQVFVVRIFVLVFFIAGRNLDRHDLSKGRFAALAEALLAVLQDLEAFVADAHIAQFDLGTQRDDVNDLQSKFARVNVRTMDMIGKEWEEQGAQMRDRR